MEPRRHEQISSFGLLILRLGVAGFLLTHGLGKVQMLVAGEFDKFPDPVGVGNKISLMLIVGAEFVCAILVMVGLLTRIAAIPVIIAMGVAALVVHANDPWTATEAANLFMSGASKSWASKEPALLFLFTFLTLFFTGPGIYSIDAMIFKRRRDPKVQ